MLLKWINRCLLSLVAVVLLLFTIFYAWGGVIIGQIYSVEPRKVLLSSRPDVITRGERLAQLYGCFRGCHGDDMEGAVFFEGWAIGKIIAPNLTRAMDVYSRSELEAIIRQGVRPDGSSIIAMPSADFSTMTDHDLSAVLSFINQYPEQDQDLGRSRYGIFPRFMLVTGEFNPEAAKPRKTPWASGFKDNQLRYGEYLAMNVCAECHGADHEGIEGFTPPLQIAKAYSKDDFNKLMMTGAGLDGRDLGLMNEVAQRRFSVMTETEVESLHFFLQSR